MMARRARRRRDEEGIERCQNTIIRDLTEGDPRLWPKGGSRKSASGIGRDWVSGRERRIRRDEQKVSRCETTRVVTVRRQGGVTV